MLEAKKATKEALWNRPFTLLFLAHSFAQIGYQALVPSLPLYLEHLGKSDQLIGMLISVFAVTAILSRPFIGRSLDRFNRKYIYMIGLVCNMLVSLLYGFVETSFGFIILRLFHGVGLGITTVAAFTVVADFIAPKRMAEGMGVFGIASVFSLALGPFIGIHLTAKNHFFEVFLLSAAFILLSIFLCWLMPFSHSNRVTELSYPVEDNLQKNKTIVLAMIIFFLTLPYSAVTTFLPLYAERLSVENVSFFFIIYAMVIFLARPVAGTIADKKTESFVIIPCIFLAFCALILLSIAENRFLFGLCAVFLGLGYGTVQPVLQSLVAKTNPSASRGKAMSTFFMGMDLSYGAGPLLFGLVAGQISYSTAFFIFAIFVLSSLFIYIRKYLIL